MRDFDDRLPLINTLHHDGQYAEALSLLLQMFDEVEQSFAQAGSNLFMLRHHWSLLVEVYPPARTAMEATRDDQTARLLAGDDYIGVKGEPAADDWPTLQRAARFTLIAALNKTLDQTRATYALFVLLDAERPELAQRYAGPALSAIVEAGDFALAQHYPREPLRHLAYLNDLALTTPLFPRVALQLMATTGEVQLGMAVLRGLGDVSASLALRDALLYGLSSQALRAMAERELDAPGTINQQVVAWRMARDDLAAPATEPPAPT